MINFRSTAEVDPEIKTMGPAYRHAVRLTVRTRDVRTFERKMLYSPGSPDNPLAPNDIIRKFTTLASHCLQPGDIDAIIELTQNLEALEDVSKLIRILGEARPNTLS